MPLQEHELVVNLESNESSALISVYIKTYWAKHDNINYFKNIRVQRKNHPELI